jgi:hypothetical protein
MNSLYVAHDKVVIGRPARMLYFDPRDRKRKWGGISKIVDLGSAGSFDPLFKTVLMTDQNRKRGENSENRRFFSDSKCFLSNFEFKFHNLNLDLNFCCLDPPLVVVNTP